MRLVKKVVRSIFFIRSEETFRDGINRHYMKLLSKFNKKHVSVKKMKSYLESIGIEEGDTIIVHCSWRGCFSFDGTPMDMISCILSIIGCSGNLLMPCYGHDKQYFDVNMTKSYAGVLSEVFRNSKGVIRSEFPDSAMCGFGPDVGDILSHHINSRYAFDDQSPYYIAISKYRAKVLLIGMGKNPHKISVFHCASYQCKEYNSFYNTIYTKQCESSIVLHEGNKVHISFLDRRDGVSNNIHTFRKLFKSVNKKSVFRDNLSLILFDGIEAFDVAYDFCKAGGKIYVKNKWL